MGEDYEPWTTVTEPNCTCGHERSWHACVNLSSIRCTFCGCTEFRTPPSPARDDAEKAIAGLLEQHQFWAGVGMCSCKYDCEPFDDEHEGEERAHRAHVASVIAAHMATPDELTALREKADWDEWACKKNQELFRQASDELTALRARIRRHVDQWLDAGSSPDAHGLGDSIRDLLGDA